MSLLARARRSPSMRSFRHRAFRRMALANLVSITGTWMQTIALSWVVLELTGSTAALGGAVAVQAAPTVLLGLWGGAVVDRGDKRRMLLATQVALAVLAALLAAVASGPMLSVGVLYALGLVTGVVHVFDGPAQAAFGTEVVPADDLANAAAIGSAVNSTGRILGMALGGALVTAVGASAVFWSNAASYLVVTAVLLSMRAGDVTPLQRSAPEAGGIRHGLAHLRYHPRLLLLIGLSFFLSSFGRNFQVTMAAMTEQAFRLDAAAYGQVSTAFAAGSLLGALAATRLGRPSMAGVLSVAGVAAAVEALAGLAPGMRTFAGTMLVAGAAAVVLDTMLSTRVQLSVDEAFRGRVLALSGLVGMAGSAMGAPLLGYLAEAFGPRAALVVGGAVAGGATLATRTALAQRRRVRLAAAPSLQLLPA